MAQGGTGTRRRRAWGALALVVSLAGGSLGAAPAWADRDHADDQSPSDQPGDLATDLPSASPGDLPTDIPGVEIPQLDWTPCDDAPALECARAMVPLDYDRPDGDQIELALARIPASADPDDRLGSLVVNRGGPGYSAVEYLAGVHAGELPAPVDDDVLARYDIVGVDPRGSGRSTPAVECFDSPEEAAQFAADVPVVPLTEAEREARADADAAYAHRCAERTGDLIHHLSTVEIAHDLDLVRAALGEERLNYLGQSYGAYLGAVYADLFTDRVGRFVVDSVLDPHRRGSGAPGTTMSSRIGSDVATRQTLEEFFRLCAAAGDACAFGGDDPAAAFDHLAATLREEPVRVTAADGRDVDLTYDILIKWTGSWLYQPAMWEQLGAWFLIGAEEALEDPTGDGAALVAELILLLDENGLLGAPYTDISQAYYGVTCPEVDTPADAAALASHADQRNGVAPDFGALRAYETSVCVEWPAQAELRHPGPWDAATDEPVLIVSSRFDPATPVWGAVRLHQSLPNSRLVINDGWGHVAAQQSTCIVDTISDYLVDGELPAKRARCAPDQVPFAGDAAEHNAE